MSEDEAAARRGRRRAGPAATCHRDARWPRILPIPRQARPVIELIVRVDGDSSAKGLLAAFVALHLEVVTTDDPAILHEAAGVANVVQHVLVEVRTIDEDNRKAS